MKGLIVKDLKMLSVIGRLYLILVSVLLVISFFSLTSFLSIYAVIFISILGPNTVAYDERDKWEKFALTMPITKAQYASSKYLLSLILSLSVVAVVTISSLIQNGFTDAALANFIVCFAVSLLYPSISLPIILRFGYSKGKLPLIVCAAVFGGAGVFLSRLEYFYAYIYNWNKYLFLILFFAVTVIFALSWVIAVNLYKKKELQ